MVKLARGPRRPSGPGRQEPVPLFPPGDLPVFGPPPANLRRPMPPPRGLGHLPGGFAPPMARPPPPPPPPPHHHMRPPMHHHLPPPHFPPVHRRPPPPPLRPLLQTPVLPPRPLPFMRGGGRAPGHMGRGPGGGPVKRLGKSVKKSKNKKNKSKDQKNDANSKKPQNAGNNAPPTTDVTVGPWITDVIKVEIEKMNNLKKEAEQKKAQADWDSYNEQKKKVESMATAAKMEYIGSQPDGEESNAAKNGTAEQK